MSAKTEDFIKLKRVVITGLGVIAPLGIIIKKYIL
jgi:hypothetical protein